jgi:enterochelin esterase family protein
MKRAGVLVLAGALLSAAIAAAGPDRSRIQDDHFQSVALAGTLHFEVYLPVDYATSARRYPVVYFLHGLPSSATAYQGVGFVEQALDQAGRSAILVAPQGARWNEDDPEYVDHGPGDRWETAIARELPVIVDSLYRTIPTRAARAIVGVSAGGFGAMHIGFAHLDAFSVIQSWSGYFHPTDPSGTKAIDLGPDNDVHRQLLTTRAQLRRLHTAVAFYIGDSDSRFAAENRQLNLELSRAGIPHVFRVYSGGHEQQLWQRYAKAWLSMGLAHLAPAQ